MLSIGDAALRLRVAGGREIAFARDDPQLRHVAYAYASTVHGAQGQTHERVIAVLDSGHGLLSNQQTFYVQLSRARENAVVLTDNREQLVETLEANTGERLTALEAIGEAAAGEAPAKPEIVREEAVSFLDGLRAERAREAEAATLRARAQPVEDWLDDAERALAAHPSAVRESPDAGTEPRFEDGAEYEVWHLGLEALVARGRTAVGEAVESGAVDEGVAARVEDSRERLARILAEEKARIAERIAAERARDWLSHWRDAADRTDPFKSRSPVATVEDGRQIAADPALSDNLRRAVKDVVRVHYNREAAVTAAKPWLRSWKRFERRFPDQDAAWAASGAPTRVARGRELLDARGLPEPLRDQIVAFVDGHDERLRVEAAADELKAEQEREAMLEAARREARRAAADARRKSDDIRRELDERSRDGVVSGAAVERCAELAASARGLAPDLTQPEASRLVESVREAVRRLSMRLNEARTRLARVWGRFGRAWVTRIRAWCLNAEGVLDEGAELAAQAQLVNRRPWFVEGYQDWCTSLHPLAAELDSLADARAGIGAADADTARLLKRFDAAGKRLRDAFDYHRREDRTAARVKSYGEFKTALDNRYFEFYDNSEGRDPREQMAYESKVNRDYKALYERAAELAQDLEWVRPHLEANEISEREIEQFGNALRAIATRAQSTDLDWSW